MKQERLNKLVEVLEIYPDIFPLIKKKYHTEEIYRELANNDKCSGSIFKHFINPPLDVINKFIDKDGTVIEYVDEKLITPEMIIRAVYSNPRAIIKIPPNCAGYVTEEIKELAFDLDSSLMSKFKFIRPEYLEDKIKREPTSIKYVKRPSDKLKCMALRADPNIILYFDKLSNNMMDIVDECYPGLADNLPSYTRSKRGAIKNGRNE